METPGAVLPLRSSAAAYCFCLGIDPPAAILASVPCMVVVGRGDKPSGRSHLDREDLLSSPSCSSVQSSAFTQSIWSHFQLREDPSWVCLRLQPHQLFISHLPQAFQEFFVISGLWKVTLPALWHCYGSFSSVDLGQEKDLVAYAQFVTLIASLLFNLQICFWFIAVQKL